MHPLFSPWEPWRKQESQGEDQSPDTLLTAIPLSRIHTSHFPYSRGAGKADGPVTGQAPSPPVQVLQDNLGTHRAQLHHLKCVPSLPSWPNDIWRYFLWPAEFIRITFPRLTQVTFLTGRFYWSFKHVHEAHQWETEFIFSTAAAAASVRSLCSTHKILPCCWRNKSGFPQLRFPTGAFKKQGVISYLAGLLWRSGMVLFVGF